MSDQKPDQKIFRNQNRSYSLRKMVGFNYEFRGNHLMLRQINEKQIQDAWLRPTQKKPDGTREVLKNFHELKDGDEVVSYWPFESNSDESDMYFDGQIMSLAS